MKKKIIVGILGFAALTGLGVGGIYLYDKGGEQQQQDSVIVAEMASSEEDTQFPEASNKGGESQEEEKKGDERQVIQKSIEEGTDVALSTETTKVTTISVEDTVNAENEKTELIMPSSTTTAIIVTEKVTEKKPTESAVGTESRTSEVSTTSATTKVITEKATEKGTEKKTEIQSTSEKRTEIAAEKKTEKASEAFTEHGTQKTTEASTQRQETICEKYGHSYINHYTTEIVHHKEPILLETEWDEPVYETHWFCNVCGLDLTNTFGDLYSGGALSHTGVNGCQSGWHNEDVVVEYIHHGEVWGWNEYDANEKVVDYLYCIDCNKIKEK